MNNNLSNFHTLKGYQNVSSSDLTPAMEDYLEMICRIIDNQTSVRIHQLSEQLNVKPSSATKIAQQLKEKGYIDFERYGSITLTEKGISYGNYLLYRHNVLHTFLCQINHTDNELEQVEKIEHFIDRRTLDNIALLISKDL